MPLIKCSECGREVSDKAQSCPNCGAPIGLTAQKQSQKAQSATGKGCLGCLGLIAVLALIGYLFPNKEAGHTDGPRDLTIMSAIQCRDS
jgi:DNA-directed RNA polymerase subunit RPC12/RpoP